MFYFQQLLNQGLAGIDRMSVIPTVTGIAYAVLLIGFLIGLYQAAMRGGDVQALGVTAVKYLIIAVIVANWAEVFREVNSSVNSVAESISNSSGAGDMFLTWADQLSQQFDSNGASSFWSLITGGVSATITIVFILIAYVVYVLALIVFAFFYTLYGCLLYTLGPLVLALLPIAGVGQLAKSYAVNVMIWNTWSIIYAILGALITAIHANQMNSPSGFLGFFTGSLDSLLLGLISVVFALAMALIPFIAKRIVSGDVGSTAQALVRAGISAAGAALAGAAGFAAGSAGSGAGASGATQSAGSSASSSSGGGGMGVASSSPPPPVPSLAESMRANVASAIGTNSSALKAASPGPSQNGGPESNGSQSSTGGSPKNGGAGSGNGHAAFMPRGIAQFLAYRAGHALGAAAHGKSRS